MSIINKKYGHGFIHVPKVAGCSMQRLPFVGGTGHATAKALRPQAPGLFWWGFVRDPLDRLVSAYHAGRRGRHRWPAIEASRDFTEFALTLPSHFHRMPHTKPQVEFLTWKNGKLAVDFVGRFERLQEDWAEVLRRIGVPHRKLWHKNKGVRPPTAELATLGVVDVCHEVYRADYDMFGYP
ncbi:MAG: sulfotransferase family 2 domain-containing protein [Planctomycetota bacterium]